MSLTFGWSPLLLVAFLVAAVGAAWWMYRVTVPLLPAGIRSVLGGLRFLALGIVLFLIAEPLLRRAVDVSDPPLVAVLLDGSSSMGIESGAGNVPAGEVDARRAVDRLRSGLREADVRIVRFGGDSEELAGDLTVDSIRFDAGRTDISAALLSAEMRYRDEGLTGIVLVSDGRYNSGRNPLHVADRFPVPIHTVAVGDTASRRDVQVRRVVTNDMAYKGRELPFDITLSHRGFPGSSVTVTLQEDGVVRDRLTIALPQADGAATVRLAATPQATGLRRFTVIVSGLEDELTDRNNTESVAVRVLESERRVLVVASAPSPDLSSLRGMLDRDPDIVVETRVQRSPGVFYEGPMPDPVAYDLLVLAGYPGSGAARPDLDRIVRAAGTGLPVLFLLARTTDQRALQSLVDLLPAVPGTVRPGFTEARILPTGEGRRHAVLTPQEASGTDPWSVLPPLHVSESPWEATPDARVLAVPEIRGIGLDDPVLVVRRRSGTRSAALLATGTWRWSNLPEDLESASGAWSGIVARLVQWLVAPEDDRPVRVRPVSQSFEGGTRVEFTGQVYDEALVPVPDASIELSVTAPDGRTLPFALRPAGAGRYEGDLGVLPEGAYSYTARGLMDDALLGEDSGQFEVGPLSMEFRDLGADADLMRQIAARSGGASVTGASADDVAGAMRSGGLLEPTLRTSEATFRLWQRWPFLAVVLVLLTVEWFLRKRRGLV